jgi:hypothetical protein
MSAGQFHRPPLNLAAHRTTVVIELGHAAQDSRIDLRTHGLSQVLAELRILHLAGKRALDAQGGTLVEFLEDLEHCCVVDFAEAQTLQDLAVDVHEHVERGHVLFLFEFLNESCAGDLVAEFGEALGCFVRVVGFVVGFCGAEEDAFFDVHLEDLAPGGDGLLVGALVYVGEFGDLVAESFDGVVHALFLAFLQLFEPGNGAG